MSLNFEYEEITTDEFDCFSSGVCLSYLVKLISLWFQQQQPGNGPSHMGSYPGNQNSIPGYGQCPPGGPGTPQWSGGYGQQQITPQQQPQQGPPGGYYPQQMSG